MSTKHNKKDASARDSSVSAREMPAQGPRLGYFIVRKSGEVVPLVAVDELPLGVDLVGVPRCLDLVETGGMLNLGLQGDVCPSGGGFYRLVGLEEDDDEGEASGNGDGIAGSSGSNTAVSSPLLLPVRSSTLTTPASAHNKSQSPKSQSQSKSLPGLASSIWAPASSLPSPRINQNSSTGTLGIQQAQQTQQTCRHWCTHNRRCKWGEHCRYKHEMPRTRFELRLIGLSDWPGWFKAENLGFFPAFGVGRGAERLKSGEGGVDVGGGMERKERERGERGGVGRDKERAMGVGIGMGVSEGETVMERLRKMEKLLRVKGVVALKGRERDEKKGEGKMRDEKKTREKEKEKLKEREREEKLDIRKAETKKERGRIRGEKIREKDVTGKINRGDLEGTRKWEDESEDISEDEGKVEIKDKGGEKGGKREGSGGEKEKLVDV
ncbi:hypothetical protein SBOR_6001 [Sclerotinia borealis F-4128]|uniref:C3H1-type domain-containing protein n=1 Tax=Sclerotinia borealis (strain F-4128) TaxID=1432307 RepID=W9CCR6_SCLBF|nr:hypothetical protein SBOR_6001 [Sclerotinia borealis F-4128]